MSDREQEIEHLERLRAIHQANIRDLEEKLALHGSLDSPPHLHRRLEREQKGLQQVETKLEALWGEKSVETTLSVDVLHQRVPVREILIGLFVVVVVGVIIAWVIQRAEPIELAFWFEVKTGDADEFVPGVEGGKYRYRDKLIFHFTPAADGYAYLFSLDIAGKFTPLWPYDSHEAGQVIAGEDYQTIEFELDDREGWEQFFAVASTQPFSYDEDVKPHLHPKSLPGGKGVDPVLKLLELREGRFFHEKITFAHVK